MILPRGGPKGPPPGTERVKIVIFRWGEANLKNLLLLLFSLDDAQAMLGHFS